MTRMFPACLLLAFVPVWPVTGAESVNPFARPELVEPDHDHRESQPLPGARPELRGVLAAGDQSVANLSGTLLAIGEESVGYRLERVTEDGAVFTHDGETVVFELDAGVTADQGRE